MRSWSFLLLGVFFSFSIIGLLVYTGKVPFPQVFSREKLQTENKDTFDAQKGFQDTTMIKNNTSTDVSSPSLDLTPDEHGLSHATVFIETESGLIAFKFYSSDAPVTIKRIVELIQQGFYKGLTFHRVVPGFVIQGGDPLGNGTGGSGQKLKAEFNKRKHVEGTVAMARAADPHSADSQFYISLSTLPHLDGQYTVIGQVIQGMDVVKKIKQGQSMLSVKIQ